MPIPRRLQRTYPAGSPPSPGASVPLPEPPGPPPETAASGEQASFDAAALAQLLELARHSGLSGLPQRPRSLEELKQLLADFGPLMNESSRALVSETLAGLEGGADADALQKMAERLRQALPG